MSGFKHNINKVIEACAEVLEKNFGFNQAQVIRFFEILPIGEFPNTAKVPLKGRENWYYLRDRIYHNALFFNYETREYRLLNPCNLDLEHIGFLLMYMLTLDSLLGNNFLFYLKIVVIFYFSYNFLLNYVYSSFKGRFVTIMLLLFSFKF